MPEKNGHQMDTEQKLRHWMGKIPDYTKELFTPERYPGFLDVMLQYSKYGFDNAVLIAAQCREKELALADRGMWEKKYGRHVKDGGEGIQVIVPAKIRKKDVMGKAGPETKKPVPELDGKLEMEETESVVTRLRVHTVYNVSQTEGRPLPQRPVCEMMADADNFDIFIKAIAAISPVPVNFAEFGSGKQEYSFNADGEIVIQKGMDAVRTMQTAARTVARALIDEIGQMMEPSAPQDKETICMETESAAYMLCRYFEMDASGWHFEDIAGWHSSMDFEALRSSMNMVRKVAVIFNDSMVDSMRQEMMLETQRELDRKQAYRNTSGKDGMEMEKAGTVRIPAVMQENQKMPPVSDMREPETALGNFSRAEIEETVFGYAQASLEDAGMAQKVEILGVRVYGSRSRVGLYTDRSDLDVVVSYKGEIPEDVFFDMLHAERFQIAGVDVDINPVSTEKTGTLEDYLKNADKYLDMKEAQMRASGQETAPRQEERTEQISFYVAECVGHPVAGRYREGLTLQAAVDLYQKISGNKAGSMPGIGFRLEGGGVHDGDYMILTDGKIQKDDIMQNTYLKDNPLVEKAVMDLETAFPDSSGQAVAEAQKKLEKEPEKPLQQEDEDVGAPSGTDVKTSGETGKMEKERLADQRKGTGKKESILKALRERQAKIKGQEKEQPKQKTQARKKGEVEL